MPLYSSFSNCDIISVPKVSFPCALLLLTPTAIIPIIRTHTNSQRKENLLIPRPVNEVYTYTIECPENMELRTPETDKTIRNAAGSLTISVKKNGRTATVTRSLELNKQLYTPAEYKDLRQLLTEWSDVNGKTLLFSVR